MRDLKIVDFGVGAVHMDVLGHVIRKLSTMFEEDNCTLHCRERESNGWLEWVAVFTHGEKTRFTL
ncbi:MAG TPA: hypothetical protein VGT79_02735, partial [Xanthomonadaceae bacterium]|nr:hypothetical protein [Xanthomonadaceae bacterium]